MENPKEIIEETWEYGPFPGRPTRPSGKYPSRVQLGPEEIEVTDREEIQRDGQWFVRWTRVTEIA